MSNRPRCFKSVTRAAAGLSVFSQQAGQAAAEVGVQVPDLAGDEDLDETHAALDEAAGDQAAACRIRASRAGRGRTSPACARVSCEMSRASLAADCMRAASS